MESRKCTKCKKNKNGDEFNGMNRMCIECLDKQKKSNKVYNRVHSYEAAMRSLAQLSRSFHINNAQFVHQFSPVSPKLQTKKLARICY